MSLPDNALSTTGEGSPLLAPDDRARLSLLEDFEKGGVALNDPSEGLDVRNWAVWSDGETVYVGPDPERTPAVAVLTGSGITEVSLAFDQNMQPTVAYVEAGLTKLWWYDTVAAAMTTTTYPGTQSPFVTMDDKREIATRLGTNDIIFAYIRDGQIYYRQQRDRYLTERAIGPAAAGSRIVQLGMGENNRLQFKVMGPPPGRFTDLEDDTLYIVRDGNILDLHGGAVEPGTWRSKKFSFDHQVSFGWVQIDSDFSAPIEVRVYGDGFLVYDRTLTTAAPRRLPPANAYAWEIEVTTTAQIVGLCLVQSGDDLE